MSVTAFVRDNCLQVIVPAKKEIAHGLNIELFNLQGKRILVLPVEKRMIIPLGGVSDGTVVLRLKGGRETGLAMVVHGNP
jgi:hypothetical protein